MNDLHLHLHVHSPHPVPVPRKRRRRPAPPWATNAAPGTAEKLAVIEWRHHNGFELWHSDDAGMDRVGIGRIPILSGDKTHRIGWRVIDEAHGRALLDVHEGVDPEHNAERDTESSTHPDPAAAA